MKTTTIILYRLVTFAGLIQIGLGIFFWTNNALHLIPLHMLVGSLFVLSIWVLAGLAVRAGVARGFIVLAAGWALLVLVLGVTQPLLLPGSLHWVIEVLHLAVGVTAIGLGESLAKRIKVRLNAATPPAVRELQTA